MGGLDYVLLTLGILYFLSILFTFFFLFRLFRYNAGAVVIALSWVATGLITWYIFRQKWYTAVNFGYLLLYFILVIVLYILTHFTRKKGPLPHDPGATA